MRIRNIMIFLYIGLLGCSSDLVSFDNDFKSVKHSNTNLKGTMKPYSINGKKYYPTIVNIGDKATGIASWYGPGFHGKKTSNGEIYDQNSLTAAHKTLPMNTILRVTNLENNKQIKVRINDRGPFVGNRIIDLSKKGAKDLDMIDQGTAMVKLEVIGFAKNQSKYNNFMIQIGAFKNINGAKITAKKYENYKNYNSTIKYNEKDELYRVFLTGFRSEEEAKDFINNNKNFNGAFIIRE